MSITITVMRDRFAFGFLNFYSLSSYAFRFCNSVIESVYASSNNLSVILFFIKSSYKLGGGSQIEKSAAYIFLILTRFRGHQFIQFRIGRKVIDERHNRAADLDKSPSCTGVGDVAHLRVRNT